MTRAVKMLGRVLAGRGIATADVAARHALAQRDPLSAFLQAFLACTGCAGRWEVGSGQVFQVFTWAIHKQSFRRMMA